MKQTDMVMIVIPVYRESLDIYERIALAQVQRVLGRYEIRLLAPRGLQINYGVLGANLKVEWFPPYFFQSKHTYSELLLSSEFYKRFLNFEYILIYQLDAFVFSDQLGRFCNLGYDYIGAPVSRFVPFWKNMKKRIGNGGFSLRKVRSCLSLCEKKEKIFSLQPDEWGENQFLLWEDLFFAFAGSRYDIEFHTPEYCLAQKFAIEHDGGRAYKKVRSGWRPFGCHAWAQIDYWFWQPLIEEHGFHLPVGTGSQMKSQRISILSNYSVKRAMRPANLKNYSLPIKLGKLAIWGFGAQGKLCLKFIETLGFVVSHIYDSNVIDVEVHKVHIPIYLPNKTLILREGSPIIITSVRYEIEIKEQLEQLGLKQGIHFFLWSELRQDILKRLCQILR